MGLLDVFLGVVRCVFFLYDVVSYPVYFAIQQTWKDKTKQNLGTVSLIPSKITILFQLQPLQNCSFQPQYIITTEKTIANTYVKLKALYDIY